MVRGYGVMVRKVGDEPKECEEGSGEEGGEKGW